MLATAPGQLVLHVGQDVGISVQGDSEAGVAQGFRYHLRVLACLQRHSREGVAASVEGQVG